MGSAAGQIIRVTSDKTISHSSRSTWNQCPRKFQLARTQTFYYRTRDSTPATNFGSGFGNGIQSMLNGEGLYASLMKAAMCFDPENAFSDVAMSRGESLGHCHEALLNFYHSQLSDLTEDWEVLSIPGFHGVEYGFAIDFDGVFERGFIDLVIRNKITDEVVVLEIKTESGIELPRAELWKNSPQGTMYLGVVRYVLRDLLDVNSRVLYINYNKRYKTYTIFPFERTNAELFDFFRAVWTDNQARALQMDSHIPLMKTGRCVGYRRDCDFLGVCGMDIPLVYPEVELDPEKIQIIDGKSISEFYRMKALEDAGAKP